MTILNNTSYNSDGLINWLRQPGLLRKGPQSHASKHQPTYKILSHPE
jgi:hypothetical protein